MYIDESEEQTGKIFNAQDSKYECKQVDEESILRPWINTQRLLEPFPVTIPYIKHIRFPTKPLRARRDRPRFLALIEASVFLHQYQREKKEMDGNQYLVATITDYSIAYELIATLLEGIVKGVSPRLKALVSAAEGLKDNSFGKKELQEKLPDWNMKTITKYLEDAERNGYVEISRVGGKGKGL